MLASALLKQSEHNAGISNITVPMPCKRLVLLHFFFVVGVGNRLEGAFRTAHIVCPVPFGHTARSALKCKHFRSADERVLPIHHTQPEKNFQFFCFPLDCVCTKRGGKQKIRYPCVAMQFLFSLFIRSISPFITRKIRSQRKNDKANHSSLKTVKYD